MLMRVEVSNYGRDVVVPTCQGDIHIPFLPGPVVMELPKQAAEEINMQPEIEVIFPEAVIPPRPVDVPVIDYSGYRRQELVSMAAQKKIKGFFTMKKAVLIHELKKLEDENAAKIR